MKIPYIPLSRYCALLVIAALAACSGSDSGSDTGESVSSGSSSVSSVSSSSSSKTGTTPVAAPQSFSMQPSAIKKFNFQWEAVEGASYYQLFENPDGNSGFALIADNIEATTYKLDVPLHLRAEASYMVQACNQSGCSGASDTASVTGNLSQAIGYIKAPMTLGTTVIDAKFIGGQIAMYFAEYPVSQYFGTVALSGDGATLAVFTSNDLGGEAEADSEARTRFEKGKPAVFIYRKNENGWLLKDKISDIARGDLSLASDGNVLAVMRGKTVDLYRYTEGWVKEPSLPLESYGRSMAFSADGSVLAVGAADPVFRPTPENPSPPPVVGLVYLFENNDGSWVKQAVVNPIDIGDGGRALDFGERVSLSADGTKLAVAASSTSLPRLSGVYLYQKSEDGQWQPDTYLSSPEGISGTFFGRALSLSADGTHLAVTEYLLSHNAHKVHIYTGESWTLQSTVIPESGMNTNSFGYEIALSALGDVLAVCASRDSTGSVAIEPTDDGAVFSSDAGGSGAGYVFRLQNDVWQQVSFIKSPNPDSGDGFCGSLAISNDSEVLAIGARGEDGSATGVGGDFDNDARNSGAVYLY